MVAHLMSLLCLCSQAYLVLKRHLSTSSSAYIRRHHRVCSVGLTASNVSLFIEVSTRLRTSLIGFESRFQLGARFGSLRGSVPGDWSSSSICGGFFLWNESELSHNNDVTATVSGARFGSLRGSVPGDWRSSRSAADFCFGTKVN